MSGKGGTALAIIVALVGWLSVLLQLYVTLQFNLAQGKTIADGLVMYFGYLTVLTNLLVCVAVTWPLVRPASALGHFFAKPIATAWVTASIAFVGVAYFLLLRHVVVAQGLNRYCNVLLHYVIPALMLGYSVLKLSGVSLRWTAPLWWGLYPVAYFIYALMRGAIIGSYPYGFIDVTALGYAVTVRNGCMLLLAFWVLGYVLMLVWRMAGWFAARGSTGSPRTGSQRP